MKIHHTTAATLLSLSAAALFIPASVGAQTPIFYNRFDNNGFAALFAMTQGGDVQLNTGLNEAHLPAVSRDGRFVAVTAADDRRPGQLSQDVYLLDLVAGGTRKIIDNNDLFDQRTQASTTWRPADKAFSPDGRALAVCLSIQSTGGVSVGPDGLLTTNGVGTVPQLMVYGVADGQPLASIYIGQQRDGSLSELMGVDWLPNTGEVITPVAVGVQQQGTGAPANTTAIVALAPITDAGAQGRVRKITNPGAYSRSDLFNSTLENGYENDLYPASSPSGRKIAFFRSVERFYSSPGFNGRLLAQVSLRTINSDGTGEQVLWNFNEGQFPTGVSWSADGNRLIIGMGTQQVAGGIPLQGITPATGQLLMIPSGGGDLVPVGVQGSASPMWAPANATGSQTGGTGGNTGPNTNNAGGANFGGNSNGSNGSTSPSSSSPSSMPVMELTLKPGTRSFVLRAAGASADASKQFLLQSSTDLKNWTTSLTVSGAMANNGITVSNGGGQAYYRLVAQ